MYDARKTTIMRTVEQTFIVGLVASLLDEIQLVLVMGRRLLRMICIS